MSNDLTIPSDRTQGLLRWGACFVAVVLLHAFAVAKLLEHSDINDAPPGSEAVEFDVALGDFTPEQQRMDYTPANPVQQQVKPEEQPEQKDAEVALPKEEQQPQPTPPTPQVMPQEEQEAKAPPKVSPDVVRKWQMTINTRLNQFKRYPHQARLRAHQGTVRVAFILDSEGHVVSARIVKSSGSSILDQETLDLLERAQPFPVPPNGASERDLFLEVPISYALR
ncbi:MAG: energy transducer TonB [Xanthobacteraceae bacterium]|nr:energy transducer TonB [Xanthobacteraceae bacterium]MBV9236727.1 energy transducer TonB [Xanthobacteraceae bacterium]MBV9627022.1 energy transducer TonB [Xanthobacteraceae bacterium]